MKLLNMWIWIVILICLYIEKGVAPRCYICPASGCPSNFFSRKNDFVNECTDRHYCYRQDMKFLDSGEQIIYRGCDLMPDNQDYNSARLDTESEDVDGKKITVKTYKCQTDLCNNSREKFDFYNSTVLVFCLILIYLTSCMY